VVVSKSTQKTQTTQIFANKKYLDKYNIV